MINDRIPQGDSPEDDIHKAYDSLQEDLIRKRKEFFENSPNPYLDRQGFTNTARFSGPSFRSQFFNVGEGLTTIAPGETKVVAKKIVPAQHGGVLTGFSQFFTICDDMQTIINSVMWGIRINGLPPQDFMDFVGDFGSLASPHTVYFPMIGASTLGTSSVSVGSSIPWGQPTVLLQATNYYPTAITVQGRLEGYTFPLAERDDEFSNI